MSMHEALYYTKEKDKAACRLCPNHCLIAEGGVGNCLSRGVIAGRLIAFTYGRVVSASVDPVEKAALPPVPRPADLFNRFLRLQPALPVLPERRYFAEKAADCRTVTAAAGGRSGGG